MSYLFQLLYLSILTGIVLAATYATCRSQKMCINSSLREALAWGDVWLLLRRLIVFSSLPARDIPLPPLDGMAGFSINIFRRSKYFVPHE